MALIRLLMKTDFGVIPILADKIGSNLAKLKQPGDNVSGLNRLDRVHFISIDGENFIDRIVYRGSKTFRFEFRTLKRNGPRIAEIINYFDRHKIKAYPSDHGDLTISVPRNISNKKAIAKIQKAPYLLRAYRWPNGTELIRPK